MTEQEHPQSWAISTGSYSDYKVVVTLRTEDEANELCEQMNALEGHGNYYFVESFPVVELPQEHETVLYMYFGYQYNFPNGPLGRPVADYGQYREQVWRRVIWAFSGEVPPVFEYTGFDDSFQVEGTDHERVRKVYSEKRAEMIAEKEGLTQ